MTVTLLHATPLKVVETAIRTCYDTHHKQSANQIDYSLIDKIANKYEHTSVIEHLSLSFYIKGIPRYCFKEETEILTDKGFKKIKDLDRTEQVLTLKLDGTTEWQKPTDYIENDYDGLMHNYKNQVIDIDMTSNHRVVYKKQDVRVNKDKIYITPSNEIIINKIKMLKTISDYKGVNSLPETVIIPFNSYMKNTKNNGQCEISKPDLELPINSYLKLLAMYISDGNVSYNEKENSYQVCITKPGKKELVESICLENNIKASNPPSRNYSTFVFKSRHLGMHFKELGHSYQKYIPFDVLSFSQEQAKVFLHTYAQFDGYKRKDSEVYTLTTTSEKLREQLYLLCLIAGYSPTIQVIDRVGKEVDISGSKIRVNHIEYRISFSTKKHRNIESTIKIDEHRTEYHYKGKTYCVTVPNGTIFVRQNNKALWCGNCLQELARHRLASLSVKSSRYTLKELVSEEPFVIGETVDYNRASQYIYFNGDDLNAEPTRAMVEALENLRSILATKKYSQDEIKAIVPECYLTNLTWTINARSLRNFLQLRTGSRALPAIRTLAYEVFLALPEEYKFLFEKEINASM